MGNGYTNKKVINIANKTKHIGVYVTESEFNRITENTYKYGFKNRAEYIRSALEFFDERRFNASKNNELNIIQDCISLLADHKKSVHNSMIQQSMQELEENLANQESNDTQNLQGNDEKLAKNLQGNGERTLQKNDENLQANNYVKTNQSKEPFESIINTLIRITAVKGRPTKDDFQYQADRCGKKASEVKHYYEDNYEFFVKESDKYG